MALTVGDPGIASGITTSLAAGGKVDINVEETGRIVRSVTDLLLQVRATGADLPGAFPPPGAFGEIGTTVAAASQQARDQIAQTVKAVGSLLQKLNVDVAQAATNSAQWDQQSGQALAAAGAGAAAPTAPGSPAAASSTPPSPAPAIATPAPTPAPATPAAPASLSTASLSTASPSTAGPSTASPSTAGPSTAGLGSVLGAAVHQAGLGQPAEPHSVEHVLNNLAAAGGSPSAQPPASALASPAGFANWLTPQNQASLGLVQVGAGPASLSAIRPGDVVVAMAQPGDSIIGIVGDDGVLYNGGSVGPASSLAGVQGVYRAIGAQSALWGTAV